MTTARRPGRPSLTDEEAWKSLRERFYRHVRELPAVEGEEPCYEWAGPATLEIAGDRGVISPTNFMLAEIGKSLHWFTVAGRTCTTRLCLNPEHMTIIPFGAVNQYASWTPNPIPV